MTVGRGRFETELDAELSVVAGGGAIFRAVRGSGNTFFVRCLTDRAAPDPRRVAVSIEDDAAQQGAAVDDLLDRRLSDVATRAPVFPMSIREYRRMIVDGDNDGADGLVA